MSNNIDIFGGANAVSSHFGGAEKIPWLPRPASGVYSHLQTPICFLLDTNCLQQFHQMLIKLPIIQIRANGTSYKKYAWLVCSMDKINNYIKNIA